MVFFWLLLNDQLNTRNLLHRKCFNIPSTNCVLSSNDLEETQKHLFFEYDSRSLCWTTLHIVWDLSLPVVDMIEQQKTGSITTILWK
jgi:hypothetical protein